MCSTLVRALSVGARRDKEQWPCLHVKQNTWGKPQPQKKQSGCEVCSKNLKEYKEVPELKTTVIFGDNQGAIAMSKNPQFHTRTKHIDIQHHYCREKVNDGTVEFQYISTGKQVADGLTKALPKDRFLLFRNALGLKERRP
ncbi:hypothetical protein BFJ68_g18416 [Fusarium oxysporum]|uniref:Copia protein n=1 Tax=Fusarium oxysporum TaxID=5507 RepID=A0A420MPM2_FUSOX|nr:hypothetical protein BFJ68_g18416 [Fusarium oxysporum]